MATPSRRRSRRCGKRAEKKKWTAKVAETFEKELGKLQRMNPAGAEFSVQHNYVQLLLELPWGEYSTDKLRPDARRRRSWTATTSGWRR